MQARLSLSLRNRLLVSNFGDLCNNAPRFHQRLWLSKSGQNASNLSLIYYNNPTIHTYANSTNIKIRQYSTQAKNTTPLTPTPVDLKTNFTPINNAATTNSSRKWIRIALELSKSRLTGLVVVSEMVGFLVAPVPFQTSHFLLSTFGTMFAAASANTFNQIIEQKYDLQMKRTKNRPLPSGRITTNQALSFAISSGIFGVGLTAMINPLCAIINASTIALYVLCYTPLKRVHWTNTYIGAIVGALPPIIGWAAATGGVSAPAYVLGFLLFAWQMPHFHAIDYLARDQYKVAGFKMMSEIYPRHLPTSAIVWAYSMLAVGPLFVASGLVHGPLWLTLPYVGMTSLMTEPFIRSAHSFSNALKSSNIAAASEKARSLMFMSFSVLVGILGGTLLFCKYFQPMAEVITKSEDTENSNQ